MNSKLACRPASIALCAVTLIAPIARGQTDVVGSFTGQHQGALCGTTAAKPDTLESFEETTVPRGSEQRFRVALATLCAAPFFKLYENGEHFDAEFTFVDRNAHSPILTYTVHSAAVREIR